MDLERRCLARLASKGMVAFSKKNDTHKPDHNIGTEMLAAKLGQFACAELCFCTSTANDSLLVAPESFSHNHDRYH